MVLSCVGGVGERDILHWQCPFDGVSVSCSYSYVRERYRHTPSIAFRHLPPNSVSIAWLAILHWVGILYLRTPVHRRCQHPPKGLGTQWNYGSNIAAKHARKHEARPLRIKRNEKESSVSIQTILVLFVLVEATLAVIKETPDVIWVIIIMITIMYIYHAHIDALSAHMIHINLDYDILYTCRAHSYQKIYLKF